MSGPGQWIGPVEQGAPAAQDDGQVRTLQAALLRMTPEQRAAMFEPFQEELSGLNQQAQPQQHTSAGGALFGGLANMFAQHDKADALKRMQQDATARLDARYGTGVPDAQARAAMAAALRKGQDPFGLPELAPTQGE